LSRNLGRRLEEAGSLRLERFMSLEMTIYVLDGSSRRFNELANLGSKPKSGRRLKWALADFSVLIGRGFNEHRFWPISA